MSQQIKNIFETLRCPHNITISRDCWKCLRAAPAAGMESVGLFTFLNEIIAGLVRRGVFTAAAALPHLPAFSAVWYRQLSRVTPTLSN